MPASGHVLLIEDHPDVADLYELKLRLEGYRVAVARDGLAGLELASSLRPDLILLDVHLPKLHGLEMLASLREQESTKDIPVVIFSEDDSPRLMEEAARLNVSAYLLKARVLPSRLAQVVGNVLKERKTVTDERKTQIDDGGPNPDHEQKAS